MEKKDIYIRYLELIKPITDHATKLQEEAVSQELILEYVHKKEEEMKQSAEYKALLKEFEEKGFAL